MRRPSMFVHCRVAGEKLPLVWKDAVTVQDRRLAERGGRP